MLPLNYIIDKFDNTLWILEYVIIVTIQQHKNQQGVLTTMYK